MTRDPSPDLEWYCGSCSAREAAPYPDYTVGEWDACTRCESGIMRVRVIPPPKRRRRPGALAALAALAFGCANPPPPPSQEAPSARRPDPIGVYIKVNKEGVPGVIAGIEGWAHATRAVRGWELVSDPDRAHVHMLSASPGTACVSTPDAIACVDRIGSAWDAEPGDDPRRVYFLEGIYEKGAVFATMHEIGHALGLDHAPGGLMQKGLPRDMWTAPWECPDPNTVDRLERHLGLRGLASCPSPVW